jgi:hypothetical protein
MTRVAQAFAAANALELFSVLPEGAATGAATYGFSAALSCSGALLNSTWALTF